MTFDPPTLPSLYGDAETRVRARHQRHAHAADQCKTCPCLWPCDAAQALDALDEARREQQRLHALLVEATCWIDPEEHPGWMEKSYQEIEPCDLRMERETALREERDTLRRANAKLALEAERLAQQLATVIRERDGFAENRNYFCARLNDIARAIGFAGKDHYAPDAVLRAAELLAQRVADLEHGNQENVTGWQRRRGQYEQRVADLERALAEVLNAHSVAPMPAEKD